MYYTFCVYLCVYLSLNAVVAQLKNGLFWVNTTIELKSATTNKKKNKKKQQQKLKSVLSEQF